MPRGSCQSGRSTPWAGLCAHMPGEIQILRIWKRTYLAATGATASRDVSATRTGAATDESPPVSVKGAAVMTLDFAEIATCTVVRAKTMQHGSEAQLDSASAGCGVCQDASLESIAGLPDMFRIDPSIGVGQQSTEWCPAPQSHCVQVMVAKAGWTARSTASARTTNWSDLFIT